MDTSGALAKVRRANRHIADLDRSIDDFMGLAYVVEAQPVFWTDSKDPNGGDVAITAHVFQPPPSDQWGPIVGDIVHNLRSALDQVAWALSDDPIEHGNFKRRDITFPVAVKEASWKSQQPKKLWALNAGDVAKIRAWQPFAAWPDQAELHPLAVLHELWNIDKHRTLHVVATSVELNQILPRIPFPGVPKVEWETVYERPRAPLVGKELIGRARMIHQPGGMIASTIPQWHMDLDLGIEIVFADGSPGQGRAVIPLLCDLSKTVQTVIAQF